MMTDPRAKKPRMAILKTRIISPITKPTATSKEAWFKCMEPECKTLCTRARDLTRHKKEKHTPKKTCSKCNQSFARKDSLDLHIFRNHIDVPSKPMVSIKTQTVWNMEEDTSPNISLPRITKGRTHTLPTKPVRLTPPALLLNNQDLDLFCLENKKEKDLIRRSCGFKRSLILKKELEKTEKDLTLSTDEYNPEDLVQASKAPDYTPTPLEAEAPLPGTSGCDSRQANYQPGTSNSNISFVGIDNTLVASTSSLNFIENIINLDFDDKELEEATQDLNNQLMNDLACSASESSLEDYYINEENPETIDDWEMMLLKYN